MFLIYGPKRTGIHWAYSLLIIDSFLLHMATALFVQPPLFSIATFHREMGAFSHVDTRPNSRDCSNKFIHQ